MKRLINQKIIPLFGLVVALLVGCQTDWDSPLDPTTEKERITLEAARAVFEQAQVTTRNEIEAGTLYSGELQPYWAGAQYSENPEVSGFDVEALVDTYYCFMQYSPDSLAHTTTAIPKVIVVQENGNPERATPYIAFYLADWDTPEFREEGFAEEFLNCHTKENYSGRIIYTDLQGRMMAASKYSEGKLCQRAFVGDVGDSLSYVKVLADFAQIVDGIYFAAETEADTRASMVYYNGTNTFSDGSILIEPVSVFTKRSSLFKEYTPLKDMLKLTDPTVDNTPVGGGGGSSSTPTTTPDGAKDGTYDSNAFIKVDNEIVHKMLDEIIKDCMGEVLIKSLQKRVIIVTDTEKNTTVRRSDCDSIYLAEGKEGAKNRNYILVEELIHVHQMENNPVGISDRKLNLEIEAKAGWMIYENRTLPPEVFYLKNYDGQLGRKGGTLAFQDLITVYNEYDNLFFNIFYESAIESLRKISGYKMCSESENHRNFDTLQELMKNCLNNEN